MYAYRLVKLARKSLLSFDHGDRRTPSDFSRAADGFIWLTRFYYLFVVYSIALSGSSALQFQNASRGPPTHPQWPITLLSELTGTGWLAHVTTISIVSVAVAALAMVFPRVLIWRLGVFLYLFLFVTLQNSYGSLGHGNHVILYVSFALLFLPPIDKTERRSGRMPRKNVMACIAVLWFTQSLILITYTLSGFWKIWRSNLDILTSDGMVRTLLDRATEDTVNIPPLLPFFAQQEYLAQFMLIVTVYVQFFALLAVFRPHLHRPFGIALIFFHLGSGWLMNISFSRNVLMVGLFIALSPMAPVRFSLSGLVQSLPLIGIPFRARARRRPHA